MQMISPTRPDRHLGSLVGGTVLGAGLVASGLGLAFMAIGTPLVTRLVPAGRPDSNQLSLSILALACAVIAGAALAVAGTGQLAALVASVHSYAGRRSPMARMIGSLPDDLVVATQLVPGEGRPIPVLIVGPFGVAVMHETGGPESIRRVGPSWETRTSGGWAPTEYPLDGLARDAERVRRWLANGDLDFVVRVYAALVTDDSSIARSPVSAVISADQIPAWIEALPKQRSFSTGRRHHLLARLRGTVAPRASRS
jgi:hypothetical protein